MRNRFLVLLAAVACGLLFHAGNSAAQGTLFTYQGRLNNSGAPANGSFDLRFALFDSVTNGSQQGVTITNIARLVTNGLFTASLDFGNQFPSAPRWLEISVRTNGNGSFTTLAPRQWLTTTPYASTASNLSGSVSGASFVSGTISLSQLSSGTIVNALQSSGQAGVTSSGMIFSTSNNPALVAAGFTPAGVATFNEIWRPLPNATPPSLRTRESAVWTGAELLVWGGNTSPSLSSSINDGFRIDPAAGTQTALPATGAPSPRSQHSAVWTGTDMIIWGGFDYNSPGPFVNFNDGARFNLTSNSWAPISPTNSPSARYGHTAVWTGTEMLVWGGFNNVSYFADGARYNPASNIWTAISPTNAPSGRYNHTAIWTGTEMIIWGGENNLGPLGDGARYNPVANTWTTLPIPPGSPSRTRHTAVWTGADMLIWGGFNGSTATNDGFRYLYTFNTWITLSSANAPSIRLNHTAVWTGADMIVWGGYDLTNRLNSGGDYNLALDSWHPLTLESVPGAREAHKAVWTGKEMLITGGVTSSILLTNDISAYSPTRLLYVYQKP